MFLIQVANIKVQFIVQDSYCEGGLLHLSGMAFLTA